jgi:hypothetical protein
MHSMESAVQNALGRLKLESHVEGVIESVRKANVFLQVHKPLDILPHHLGSEYHRLKFIEESMTFIPPVPIVFNPDAPRSKQCTGQYVPIKATLEQMLNDMSYKRQAQVCTSAGCECISGIYSGSCYKANTFFRDNPTAVPILLYSDGLCLTNPLNSNAAKKNKIVGVYMTLGSVAAWNRSKVDSTQLVMLVKEKHCKTFGLEVIYRQLIQDLKGCVSMVYNN